MLRLPVPLTSLLCCAAVILATSCGSTPRAPGAGPTTPPGSAPSPGNPSDDTVLKLAQVESVQAEILPTKTPEAVVVIHGLLHDGATRVHEVQQQRLADGFVLTVVTARPRKAMATLALIPFERSITLNLQGMPKGPCRIVANGIATTIDVP